MNHPKKLIASLLCILMTLGMLLCAHVGLTSCQHTQAPTGDKSEVSVLEDLDEDELPSIVQLDTYYIGKVDGKECIITFKSFSKKSFTAILYKIEDKAVLEPITINGKVKKRKCIITLPNKKVVWHKLVLNGDADQFRGEYDGGSFSFKKHVQPAFKTIAKQNRYKEECFEIETIRDVKYGTAKGYWVSRPETSNDYGKIITSGIAKTISKKDFDLYMDIYLPKDDTMKQRPMVMFIHGGGFFIGDKRDNPIVLWCQHYAKMGYVAVSINYRMGFKPSKTSIERCGYSAAQDAHAAMRFLIHNKEKYRINPNYLFVAGSSAGGITTLNLAFMRNANRPESAEGGLFNEDLGNIESSGNSLKETFKLRCIANMWGSVHDINMIDNAKISIISFHGDADKVVPYGTDVPFKDLKLNISNLFFNKMYGSKSIHERAKKLGYREELHTFPGCGHAPHVDANNQPNEKFYFIQEKTTDFFYREFVPEEITIQPVTGQTYAVNAKGISTCYWRITGGFILSTNKGTVRAVWLPNASERKLECVGRLESGAGFSAEYVY